MDAIPQVDESEYDALHDYLASFDSSDECMLLSELDGFLTALAVSPQPIGEEEWLPVALGDPPVFASAGQGPVLLGVTRPRQGPQPGAGAAAQDHRNECALCHGPGWVAPIQGHPFHGREVKGPAVRAGG